MTNETMIINDQNRTRKEEATVILSQYSFREYEEALDKSHSDYPVSQSIFEIVTSRTKSDNTFRMLPYQLEILLTVKLRVETLSDCYRAIVQMYSLREVSVEGYLCMMNLAE
jgi:hypothetical protein